MNDPTATSLLSGRPEPEEAGRPATTSGSGSSANGGGTSRLEKVSATDLCDFKGEHQLLSVMYGAIVAHQRLHREAGIVHGDVNPNTIVILETEDGEVEGALIDFDMPLCRAAMRKLKNPDPVVPPRQRRERCIPAYYKLGPRF